MAGGELGAGFEAVAEDAAKAGENLAHSVADVLDKTAGTEEANLDAVLRTEERNAKVLVGDRTSLVDAPGPPTIGDPAFERGPLGPDFSPGMVDPRGQFSGKEGAIASRLAQEGWRVDARAIDHSASGKPNPDAMVRKGPDDPGRVSEFKTTDSQSPNALKREINDASNQAGPDGSVVIDGREVGTTRSEAERAFRRAVGQPGRTVSKSVHVILG